MPIPEFNEIKAPVLQMLSDGVHHKVGELYAPLADDFRLTEDERNELLPSGKQRRWHNRVNWACYDLFRARLLDRPKKGLYIISQLGKTIADQKPKVIDRNFLMQFPAFAEFVRSTRGRRAEAPAQGDQETSKSPEEPSTTPEE